jgi:hypothetical protein
MGGVGVERGGDVPDMARTSRGRPACASAVGEFGWGVQGGDQGALTRQSARDGAGHGAVPTTCWPTRPKRRVSVRSGI